MTEGTSQAFSMRIVLAVFALPLLLMTTFPTASQAVAQTPEGTVRVVPAISSVVADRGPFTVFVVLEDLRHYGTLTYDDDRDTVPERQIESTGLAAFEFTIGYDQAVLELADVEQGPGLGRTGRTFQCLPPAEEPGSLSFGCLSIGPEPPGAQGTLTLASVTMRPVGPGSSPLLLEAVLAGPLGSDDVPVTVKGGAVRVTGRPAVMATATAAGGGPAHPNSESDAPPLDTPAPAFTQKTPTTRSLPEHGRPPESPTASSAGEGEDPQELIVRGQDFEAENESSAEAGSSAGGTLLWSAGAAGGLVAAGTLGLAAIAWRRRKHQGGA